MIEDKTGPLAGLIVVDASWGMPGDVMTLLLADNGATVIKIERPAGRSGPVGDDDLLRLAWSRGKRSLTLDLTAEADRRVLHGLLAKADVFVDSFGAGKGEALGLDHGTLGELYPRLIHTALSAYGQDGPWRDEPGWDCLVAAKMGLMSEQASLGREGPVYLGHPNIANGAGLLASIATLAAVRARHLTGKGQFVDVSLLDSVLVQTPMNHWHHPKGLSHIETEGGKRMGFGRKRLITAAFECQDGEYIQIHSGGQGGFRSVMEIFGFGEICQTVTSGSDMSLPLNDEEYVIAREYIPEAFKQRPRAEWLQLFEARDVATLPVLRQGEVLADAQVKFADRVITVEGPAAAPLQQAAPPLTYEKSRGARATPAPYRGQDNEALRAFAEEPPPIPPSPPAKPRPRALRHAMQGVRILDFSTFFATAYGAKLLSDLGADVIVLEPPGGDQLRPLPNPFEAAHRGKRSLIIDLKTPDGQAVAQDLARTADVVMHNQRPGKADKIGIGYPALSKINPRLIYCYLPGFGSAGPRARAKSFAPLQSGFCGLLYEGAGVGNPPVRSIEGNEDYYNGLMGANAVLCGLEWRERTGEGQYIESPQLHSTMFVGSHHFLTQDHRSLTALPMDREQTGLSPLYRLYRTGADGWICIAVIGERAFSRLAGALDLPAGVGLNDADLADRLSHAFLRLTSQEAFDRLRRAGVACEIPSDTPQQPSFFFNDWALRTGRVVEQPDSMHGYIREIGLCMRLSDTPGLAKGPAPRVGQHSREILGSLQYTPDHIAGLIARGIVQAEG